MELKFRAWNTVTQTMFHPDYTDWEELHILIDGEVQSAQRSGYYDTISVYNRDDVKLMQYTRLKDKNGVEIFEGDILSSLTTGVNYEIIYSDMNAAFIAKGKYIFPADSWLNGEVIGNIHQNPELL